MWCRLGPVSGRAGYIVWQPAQAPFPLKIASPALAWALPEEESALKSGGGLLKLAAQASNSPASIEMIRYAILPCWMPQNSTHWAGKFPATSALNQRLLKRLGKTS